MSVLSDYALVSLAEAKRFLRVPTTDTDDDDLIMDLINDASDEIEKACDTYLIQRSVTEDHPGGVNQAKLGGAKRIYLRKSPVNSVSQIIDDDSDTVSSDDYTIVAPNILEHDTEWPIPDGRWSITYNAGWFANLSAVDYAVRKICKQLVLIEFVHPDPTLIQKEVDDLQLRFQDLGSRRNWIRLQLGPYINWSV